MSETEAGKGRSVLIALSDATRAARLGEACDRADITTGIAVVTNITSDRS